MDLQIPLKLNEFNDIATYTDIKSSIKSNIKNLLSKTDMKSPFNEERALNYDFLYQNGFNEATIGILHSEILNLLENYEKRIKISEIAITYYEKQKTLVINVKYYILKLQQGDSTSFLLNI